MPLAPYPRRVPTLAAESGTRGAVATSVRGGCPQSLCQLLSQVCVSEYRGWGWVPGTQHQADFQRLLCHCGLQLRTLGGSSLFCGSCLEILHLCWSSETSLWPPRAVLSEDSGRKHYEFCLWQLLSLLLDSASWIGHIWSQPLVSLPESHLCLQMPSFHKATSLLLSTATAREAAISLLLWPPQPYLSFLGLDP